MIVGREAELAAIQGFVEAPERAARALVLAGEAGIGKTTLWQAGLELARERGLRVVTCSPAEVETKLAYSALVDLLDDAFDLVAPTLPTPRRHALERALLRGGDQSVRPDQRAVSLGVLAVLRELANEGALVVGIDDVRWLDDSSARVLRFALRRLEAETLRLLLTSRDGGPPQLAPNATVLPIGPLDVHAVHRLLETRLGRPVLRSGAFRIHRISGGNPFLALELERAAARRDEAAPAAIPETLRELVGGRLGRLPAQVRAALLVVAALDKPTPALVAAALEEGASEELEAAVEAGILTVDRGRLRFVHPLVGSIVYGDASPLRRRTLHRRLARLAGDIEERARHLALATSLPHAEVAATLDLAAESASERGAPDAAADFCEQALRLTPAEEMHAVLRRTLAASEFRFAVGETERARALLADLAEGLAPGPPRAEVLRRLARVRALEEGWPEALALLGQALEEAGVDVPLRAAIECDLGHVRLQYGELRGAHPHARRAVELAAETEDHALLADARLNLAALEFQLGVADPEELARIFAPTSAEADGPAPGVVHRALYAVIWRKYSDDFEAARTQLDAVAAALRERYEDGLLGPVLFQASELEAWAGNLEQAERLSEEARNAVDRSGQAVMRARLLYLHALLAALRGRADDARTAAQSGLALAAEADDRRLCVRHHATLGFLALSVGDALGARAQLDRAAEIAAESGYGEPGMFRYAADRIEVLIALGELERAEAALAELEEQGRRLDRAWALATAARCRGLLVLARGDHDGAVAVLEDALGAHDRLPQPVERARTLLALGTALRLARRKRLARETLEEALATFERVGTPLWAEKARAELARIGGRKAAGDGLTATEQKIAALVAAGRSNKEVAAELFVAPRTVEGHLSHIYEKLGITSRAQLAGRFAGLREQ